MRKIIVWGGVAILAIILGLTACSNEGGDLQIINDTDTVRYFRIYFNGAVKTVNDGQNQIHPSQKVNAHSEKNTSYAVYISTYYIGDGTKVSWSGNLSGGSTVQLRISELND